MPSLQDLSPAGLTGLEGLPHGARCEFASASSMTEILLQKHGIQKLIGLIGLLALGGTVLDNLVIISLRARSLRCSKTTDH